VGGALRGMDELLFRLRQASADGRCPLTRAEKKVIFDSGSAGSGGRGPSRGHGGALIRLGQLKTLRVLGANCLTGITQHDARFLKEECDTLSACVPGGGRSSVRWRLCSSSPVRMASYASSARSLSTSPCHAPRPCASLPMSRCTGRMMVITSTSIHAFVPVVGVRRRAAGRRGRYASQRRLFCCVRLPLIRGRLLIADDLTRADPVVVVNEWYASSTFPGEDAIGKRGGFNNALIVGIVGHSRVTNVRWEEPAVYRLALPTEARLAPAVIVRTASSVDPESLFRPIEQVVRRVNPRLLVAVRTSDDALERSIARGRSPYRWPLDWAQGDGLDGGRRVDNRNVDGRGSGRDPASSSRGPRGSADRDPQRVAVRGVRHAWRGRALTYRRSFFRPAISRTVRPSFPGTSGLAPCRSRSLNASR
jgi:hypothetical protein